MIQSYGNMVISIKRVIEICYNQTIKMEEKEGGKKATRKRGAREADKIKQLLQNGGYSWQQQAKVGESIFLIDEASFQTIRDSFKTTSKHSIPYPSEINHSILLPPSPLAYTFQSPILKDNISETNADPHLRIGIISREMNDYIFGELGCRGKQVERRIIKVGERKDIELYPNSIEMDVLCCRVYQDFANAFHEKKEEIELPIAMKMNVTVFADETAFQLKQRIVKLLKSYNRPSDVRVYSYDPTLFRQFTMERYLEYFLKKQDVEFYANSLQLKFYTIIEQRSHDAFLTEFYPGKYLTNQSIQEILSQGTNKLVVDCIYQGRWIFPQQPVYSIAKICRFCTLRTQVATQFICPSCKLNLMFCSRVCFFQGLHEHPCNQAREQLENMYGKYNINGVFKEQQESSSTTKKESKVKKTIFNLIKEEEALAKTQKKEVISERIRFISMSPRQDGNRLQKGGGLANLGNTCYMNAAIQSLFHTSLTACLESLGFNIKNKRISCAFLDLIYRIEAYRVTPNKSVSFEEMNKFKQILDETIDTFVGYEQHDVHEFLTFFLDKLNDQLKEFATENIKKIENPPQISDEAIGCAQWFRFITLTYSPIVDLFYGQQRSEIVCPNCNYSSVCFSHFNAISLSIPTQNHQTNINLYYESYLFSDSIKLINLTTSESTLLDLLSHMENVYRTKRSDKTYLRGFRVGYEGEGVEFNEETKIASILSQINAKDTPERQLFIFETPIPSAQFVLCKFVGPERKTITFKRPFFYLAPLVSKDLYMQIVDYLISLMALYYKNTENMRLKMQKSVKNYFKLRVKSQGRIVKDNKVSFTSEGKILEVDNSVVEEANHSGSEIWVQFQKFDRNREEEDAKLYNLIMNKLNKYVKIEDKGRKRHYFDEKQVSIESCLYEEFSKKELLAQGNEWYCPYCREKRRAHQSNSIYKAPQYLIIQLKRFRKGNDGTIFEKNNSKVRPPLILNLKGILVNPTLPETYYKQLTLQQRQALKLPTDINSSESCTYRLKSIIVHDGEINGGHYTAISGTTDTDWWHYNDEMVTKVDIREKLNLSLFMEQVYIMVYEREA